MDLKEKAVKAVELLEKEYPEATMLGTLPAKGFFVRHARNVTLENIVITTEAPDNRPDIVKIDTE